jgi:thiosulfate/3-mercaptopyruvate sulfurtransferase
VSPGEKDRSTRLGPSLPTSVSAPSLEGEPELGLFPNPVEVAEDRESVPAMARWYDTPAARTGSLNKARSQRLGCPVPAIDAPRGPLVSPQWVDPLRGAADLKLLDATWTWEASDQRPDENFLRARIPGSVYFDHASMRDPESPFTDTRPSADTFCRRMGALGIRPSDTVVIYSQKGTDGGASRAWWLLRSFGHERVFVLDGGLPRWKAEGRELSTEAGAAPEPCDYGGPQGSPREDLVVSLEQVKSPQLDEGRQLLDARPPKFFRGDATFASGNPRVPEVEPGHMPGSINFPAALGVDPETRMLKSASELRALLSAHGIDLERPVTTSCSLGIAACTAALMLEVAGATDYAVFDGSWQVWGSDPDCPKAVG